MNNQEILDLIDQRIANLDKANDHVKWIWDTNQDLQSWGNYQYIGGAWEELINLKEEIVSILSGVKA